MSAAVTGRIGSARAWWTVALLSTLYVLSFIDRLILALLVSPLKAGLGVSDVQLGLLFGPAFGMFYAVLGLPLARLADRGDRRKLIIAGVLIWGTATIASGFAGSFAMLVALRIGLAIGEAALTPAAFSMIGDLFAPQRRVLAASIYSAVGLSGGFTAYLIGAMIIRAAESTANTPASAGFQSWQLVFFAVGIPSIVVGTVFALTTREPVRAASEGASKASFAEVIRYVRRHAALYVGLFAGGGLLQAIGFSWTAWGPELAARTYALPVDRAGSVFGITGLVAVFGGSMLFPMLSRRLASAGRTDAIALTSMAGVVSSVLLSVCATWQATPTAFYVLMMASMFCTVGGTNNVLVGMQTLAPPHMRATLVAGLLLSITILGMCIGPPASAAIAAMISPTGDALGAGIAILSLLIAVPCLGLFAWSRRGLNDLGVASHSAVTLGASTVTGTAEQRSPTNPVAG